MFRLELTNERFDIIFQGILATRRELNRMEAHQIARVLNLLEDVSKPHSVPEAAAAGYRELIVDIEVPLPALEFILVSDCIRKVVWPVRSVQAFARVDDWLDSLKEE